MAEGEACKILKTKLGELSSTPSISPSSSSSSSSSSLDPSSSSSPDPFILKVPHQLRQTMEICKARYLSNLLARQLYGNQGANEDGILSGYGK
ncbi:hypothetical protein PTKIN_Ptkin06aG0185100 [Pterospermum kingtungense]